MTLLIPQIGRGLLVGAGLLLPGAGWALAFRWPLPWFAAGVFSALAIFAGVLGGAVLGWPINLATLSAWLCFVGLPGGWLWWRRRPLGTMAERQWGEWWLALPAVPMLVVATWRAWFHSLPGADNVFRWDHLARLIVRFGNLDFYPPHSSDGFALYFWADGIAPLLSGLYAWTYLAAGSTDIRWTAVPVLLQMPALLALLYGLARLWGPGRGGWLAIALAGATMLLQFAFCLGQETGLTALGAGGMVLYLTHWRRGGSDHLLIPAAACAALAACAREYGIAFMLAGAAWVALAPVGWRLKAGFALGAGVLPAAWHVRNWVLTGNPFYAQDVGGLFPVNPVFHTWMQGYVNIYGKTLIQVSGWREIARLLLMSAVPALLGFFGGMIVWRRTAGWIGSVSIGILSVAAWAASVPFTAGGFFYSMRVLSPLLVVGCAWGGACLARWIPGRRHLAGLQFGLVLFGADAALRAWTIPINPYSVSPREWPEAGYRIQLDFARDDQAFLENLARHVPGKVLSDSAGVQPLFQQAGRTLVPLWSPEVGFLFSPDFKGDAVTRLRELGYSHLLLKRAQFTVDFLTQTGALKRLEGRLQGQAENEWYALFSFQPVGPENAAPH